MFAKNGVPLYIQLKNDLLKDINKNYKVGDIIPSEGRIENKYGVSRITVRKAIEELERESIVIKKQGKGTFVKEPKILYEANFIGSLTQRFAKKHHAIKTTSIDFKIIEGGHYVKEMLKCKKLLCIKRTRLLDDEPFALMLNFLNMQYVPNLENELNKESLYGFLKDRYDLEFYSAEETVSATSCTSEQAKVLHVEKNHPLLKLERLSFNKDGKAVEFSDILILADMYKHKINLSREK